MRVEHSFESSAGQAEAHARLAEAAARLRAGRVERVGERGAPLAPRGDAVGGAAVPLVEPLRALLPEGLRRGDVAVVASRGGEPTYLLLALIAGALTAGLWAAAVGVPGLGGLALAELLGPQRESGLKRLLVVRDPDEAWPKVVETLAEGVDLVVVRPPGPVPAGLRRRIETKLRAGRAQGTRHQAALVVLGAWPGAQVELRTVETVFTGLSGDGLAAGTGHVTGCRATVTALGKATAGRTRVARLWLPDHAGQAQPLIEEPARSTETPSTTAVA